MCPFQMSLMLSSQLARTFKDSFRDGYNANMDDFIRGEFAKLGDGMHVNALHALIHMGYGHAVNSSRIVVEGMAYLHFSHQKTKLIPRHDGRRTSNIFDALTTVRNDVELRRMMREKARDEEFMPTISGQFQREVGILCTDEECRAKMEKIVLSIEFPNNFEIAKASIKDVLRLMDQVLQWALTAYACSDPRNDFFLLHGVTGAWSLLQFLHLFSTEQAIDFVQQFIAVLLSAYCAQDCPSINLMFLRDVPDCDMKALCVEAYNMRNVDEHIYKLVQVCKWLAKRHLDKPEVLDLCKVASRCVMDHDFSFSSK